MFISLNLLIFVLLMHAPDNQKEKIVPRQNQALLLLPLDSAKEPL